MIKTKFCFLASGTTWVVHFAPAFEDAKHNRFTPGSTAPFSGDTLGAKVRFIDLHSPFLGCGLFTPAGDLGSQLSKIIVTDRN